ncbi:MAG: glycosyltransferase family 2 protein [Cyanobacteria bacterium P01_D01_bin.105]
MTTLSNTPFVSVIIPVYNDDARLNICLHRLSEQTYPHVEIIVVDNGSTDLSRVAAVVNRYPAAKLISEPKPGSYAARNTGIAHAKGDILAFTDADCLPVQNWLACGVAQMKTHPDCGLIAGAIHIISQNHQHPVELYERIMALNQQKFVEQDQFGATANLLTRPDVFKSVGLFNAELKSSGDVDWGQRVFAAGYTQIYADNVCIGHPARQTFAQLAQQASRHAGGFYQVRCQQHKSAITRQLTFFKLLGFHLMPPVMFAVNIARHPQLQTPMQVAKVVFTLIFIRAVIVKALLRLKLGGMAQRA